MSTTALPPLPTAYELSPAFHRHRLEEHLARVEVRAARAAFALLEGDTAALDAAMRDLVREARLAEQAHIRLWNYESQLLPKRGRP